MNTGHTAARAASAAILCIALCYPFWAAGAGTDDIAELKRAMEMLQAQNRALAERIAKLEAEKSGRGQVVQHEQAPKREVAESRSERDESRELERLELRVNELEIAKTAHEDATRSIIRDSVSTLGSNINESVALGGTLEVVTGRSEDLSGQSENSLGLNTAEHDLEIQVNDWTYATSSSSTMMEPMPFFQPPTASRRESIDSTSTQRSRPSVTRKDSRLLLRSAG